MLKRGSDDASPRLTIQRSSSNRIVEHRNGWIEQKFTITTATTVAASSTDNASADITVGTITNLAPAVDASYKGLTIEVWDTTLGVKRGTALIVATGTGTIKLKNLGASFTTVSGDICYVIGNAFGEGQTSPEAWADELKTVYGSTQIFRTPVEITGTLHEACLRGESKELARLRLIKQQEHKIQKERAFLFQGSPAGTGMDGTAYNDTAITDADGKTVRTTMGLIAAIEKYGNATNGADNQNIFNRTGSTYKYGEFIDDMERVFQYLPEAGFKYAFCGRGAISYFSKVDTNIAKNSNFAVQMSRPYDRDSLGFNIKKLETPHGDLHLIPTPVLRGPYKNRIVIPSDENLFHAQYRAAKYSTNIKTENGYDGVKDEYFSDEGIGMTLIESHFMMNIG